MRSEHSLNKSAHGRWAETIDLTGGDYEAPTDGQGVPIPFQLNCQTGGIVTVRLVDEPTTPVDLYFNPGDNPALVILVDDGSAMSTGLAAIFPYKPCVTTINTTY